MLFELISIAYSGIFLAFLGRGPRALWFRNFIGVKQQIGEIVKLQNFRIFRKECLELHGVLYIFISFDFTNERKNIQVKEN